MDNLMELTVIPQVISSNLLLHHPNNPKNEHQHLPKMLSSDKHFRMLLCRTRRSIKTLVIIHNR